MDTGQFLNRHGLILIAVGCGIAVLGMAVFTAGYTYAESPGFCGSCHSMEHAHTTWQASNHKQIACGECHLPQGGMATKMFAKIRTGMKDVYHETVRDYPAAITVSAQGKQYIADNCLRCHQSTVENTKMAAGEQDCGKCHRGLVHGMNKGKGGIHVE